MQSVINISQEALTEFCRRNGVARLSVFGSVLKGTATEDSDIDLLVEFLPNRTPGYFGISGMELELAEQLGRKVDLRTPAELSRYFRDEVLQSAELLYAA